MVKRSCVNLKASEAGDNVAVPISMIDMSRVDQKHTWSCSRSG